MQDLLTAAKAFSEPVRLRAIAVLRLSELCVCELCDALELPQSTLSTHLQLLRQSGFVQTRNEGKWVYYGLTAATAPVTNSLFALYTSSLASNERLQRDAARVRQRLKLRTSGQCLLGFNQLGKEVKSYEENHVASGDGSHCSA